MPRILFLPAFVFLLGVAACGSGHEHAQDEAATAGTDATDGPAVITDMTGVTAYYECPMKCDGKQYDGPGPCPVCGMDLVRVEVTAGQEEMAPDSSMEHNHDHDDDHDHEGHDHEGEDMEQAEG